MDECLRSCNNKRSVEEMGASPEVENGGVRARTKDEISSKRRRSHVSQLMNVPMKSSSLSSPANSTTSLAVYTVCELSSDVLRNDPRSAADLKPEDSETESSTFDIGKFRETSASSELNRGDSGEVMESSSTRKNGPSSQNSETNSSVERMPSAAEIEEFFSKFEKDAQKQFAEKYNYDIVKDVPMEGRYEWVRLWP